MNQFRRCSRPGCGKPAVATLTYAYAQSTAVVGPLLPNNDPHSWDLCEYHASRITAPLGWELVHVDNLDEDDEDLSKVSMDISIFKGFTEGYLSEAASFLTRTELDYLAFSAKYITYEQVLRFLMDYIDGDKYYKTKDKNHNLRRTRAQYKLLTSMEEQYTQMCDIVNKAVEIQRK